MACAGGLKRFDEVEIACRRLIVVRVIVIGVAVVVERIRCMITVYLYQREGGYFLRSTKSRVASRSVVEDV